MVLLAHQRMCSQAHATAMLPLMVPQFNEYLIESGAASADSIDRRSVHNEKDLLTTLKTFSPPSLDFLMTKLYRQRIENDSSQLDSKLEPAETESTSTLEPSQSAVALSPN